MIKLTVFFEDPFWIGIFEKTEGGSLEICKVVFGQEPKDYEVYMFILGRFNKLKFSKPLKIEKYDETKINPKRMQRKIKKAVLENGIGTKAQQAIKLDFEKNKAERKLIKKEKRELLEAEKYQKKLEKKKQKKKGH